MLTGNLHYIDLFAGAGGLSEGFAQEGYVSVAHVEMDPNACDTLRTRECYHYLRKHGRKEEYYQYLRGRISKEQLYASVPRKIIQSVICETMTQEGMPELFKKIDQIMRIKKIPHVDVMLGGPPCQAYSVVGRARKDMADDPRNFLYKLYLQAIKKYLPDMIVFENVPGILSAGGKSHFRDLTGSLKELGYEIKYDLCNASDYGVLQNRKRIILVGWRKESGYHYPDMDKVDTSCYTVNDLLSDLPAIQPGETCNKYLTETINPYLRMAGIRDKRTVLTLHEARSNREDDREIYRKAIEIWNNGKGHRLTYSELPEELQFHKNTKDFQDRFKVVAATEHVSQTMVAHISKDGHYYIHPDIEQARSLSIREAARIQSFPDDFFFEGGRTAAFRQIGNAVPPLLAKAIAKAIRKQFEERDSVG